MKMARTLNYLFAAVLFVSMSGPVAAQSFAQAAALARKGPAIAPAYRADIEKLMEITGVSAAGAEMAITVSDMLLESLKEETQQSMPPRAIEVVREVLSAEFVKAFNGSEIKDQQIALYAKYFTHEDVKGLIAFYESDIGRKAIATLPSLTREGAAIGERWGRANMPRVIQVLETRLKAEGLTPSNATLR